MNVNATTIEVKGASDSTWYRCEHILNYAIYKGYDVIDLDDFTQMGHVSLMYGDICIYLTCFYFQCPKKSGVIFG